jgi:outer membrane protein assembly factor BamB
MLHGRLTCALFAVGLVVVAANLGDAADWTRFRGPNGTGIAADQNIPVHWTSKNILWQKELPAPGNSSAVVWKERLFVQGGSQDGKQRMLICMDVKDGTILWVQKMPGSKAKIQAKNTFASGSPGVDSKRVYAAFWDGEKTLLAGYSHDGKDPWVRDIGPFASEHGAGASPIPIGDKIYYCNDQDKKSELLCLDPKTGGTIWNAPRIGHRACYSSPIVRDLPDGKGKELLIVSTTGITGYDPNTGDKRWNWEWPLFKNKQMLRTVGSPVYDHGILFATSGDSANGPRHAVAVRLDPTPKLVWENRADFPYVPSILSHGKYLYFVNDAGMAGCFEAETGKKMWFERLDGTFSSSPVLIGGKIYIPSEYGDVYVLAADPNRFQILAKNSLGEVIRSTPAVVDDRMYIRGMKSMFCVGNP